MHVRKDKLINSIYLISCWKKKIWKKKIFLFYLCDVEIEYCRWLKLNGRVKVEFQCLPQEWPKWEVIGLNPDQCM